MNDFEARIAALPHEKQEQLRRLVERDGGVSNAFPLSHAQERLWFLNQLAPANPFYNIPLAMRLSGALDVGSLALGWKEIGRRHEVLRTSFVTFAGQPLQVISQASAENIPLVDLQGLEPGRRDEAARALAAKAYQRPFDLQQGGLGRLILVQLDDEEFILLVTVHHIVSDGWSMGVVVRELETLYQSMRRGEPSPFPPLPIQYKDFALWQRQWLSGEGIETELAYWKRQLAGAPAEIDLPTDRPRPPVQSFRGATERITLTKELSADLKRLASLHGMTLFQTLLAAFATLLARHSRQTDILVGTAATNRSRPELERLIGFFANTLVLRLDVSGDPTFNELLALVREVVLEALTHQELPFEKLVEAMRPERHAGRNPIFQVAFDLQNSAQQTVQLENLRLNPVRAESGWSRFDLRLSVRETSQGLNCSFEYATDLFDRSTIQRLGEHYRTLLCDIAKFPDKRLSDLALLTPAEFNQVVREWNGTQRPEWWPRLAHRFFEQVAGEFLDTPALVFEKEYVTYAELDRRANWLAVKLRSLGAGPECIVGILLERSVDMIVAIMGVLKSGAAYLPLDPAHPRERLHFLLEDSQAGLVLTHSHLKSKLPANGIRVFLLDDPLEAASMIPFSAPLSAVSDDNLAYVIYTSGSTGKPKGACLTHRSLCNLAMAFIESFDLRPDRRILQFSSLSFDAAVVEIFMTLLCGATLHLARQGDVIPGPGLVSLLRDQRITVAIIPPSVLTAVPAADLPDLSTLIVAGEACSAELVTRWTVGRCFYNAYGPTEATVCASFSHCTTDQERPHIGRSISNVQVYILDRFFNPAPIGVPGELCIGGVGVGRGYLRRSALTADRFVPDPFGPPGARLYRSGDLVRLRPDGNIDFAGRIDHQIKLRGFRIEPGEIERVLCQHAEVRQSAVVATGAAEEGQRLVAYYVGNADERELRAHLAERLPAYMVPSVFVALEAMPLNSSGKLDLTALPNAQRRNPVRVEMLAPQAPLEKTIAQIWSEVLDVDSVGLHDNFFDIGGHSLLLARVHDRLQTSLQLELAMIDLFTYPTVSSLAAHLNRSNRHEENRPRERTAETDASSGLDAESQVAIVGMSLRIAGSRTREEFWINLCNGVETITFFTDAELLAEGIPAHHLRNPRYVKAGGFLEGVDLFDAAFFGVSPKQAMLWDPQHRHFLECAWEALEDAGYASDTYEGSIGVFAGTGTSTYLFNNLLTNPAVLSSTGLLQAALANDKDHLAMRASYFLNLRGPSVTIQTACSTSLVAIHFACRSLLSNECDVALAGGVSVNSRRKSGYFCKDGALSPDGHCRAFDAKAAGTVGASGVGIVVLKRLSDAVRDGDTIHAVIRGSAINNDGSAKVGYTAPGIEGQVQVIREAQKRSCVTADEISYVEAHGTGTELGDPIEVAALTRAFRATTDRRQYCALGSLKASTGHLDAAAGVASLIKTALALEHGLIPPSINFTEPNPRIDFESSPFFVNEKLREWRTAGLRRAGVSSFGVGGTNAHVILEEAPPAAAPTPSRPAHLLVISARTSSALKMTADNIAQHLQARPDQNLADVECTLQAGRRMFAHRQAIVCRSSTEAVDALEGRRPERVISTNCDRRDHPIVFMFTGHGSEYMDMGRELYEHELVFRTAIDRCARLLEPILGIDLRNTLYPTSSNGARTVERLREPALAQPILFAIEYALAQLWISWIGLPQAMLAHSVGEYAAACVAGVLSLDDALALVAARGHLMQETDNGAMLSVALSETELLPLLGPDLCLAAINGPDRCVAAGATGEIEGLQALLAARSIDCRRLHVSKAGHSRLMEPILDRFAEAVSGVALHPPGLRFVSSVTGTWITPDQATDPSYWVAHLRRTVRFADGLAEIWRSTDGTLLEVGPGRSLTTLALQHPQRPAEREVLSSLSHALERTSDLNFILTSLGRLWAGGVSVDWQAFHSAGRRRHVPLPTYPFERVRHWIEPAQVPTPVHADGIDEPNCSDEETEEMIHSVLQGDIAKVQVPGLKTGAVCQESIPANVQRVDSASRTELERQIAALWEELLGCPVGLHDNFFDLGGDSLIAFSLTAGIRHTWNVDLPLRRILEAPTVSALAVLVNDALAQRTAPPESNEGGSRRSLQKAIEIQAGIPSRLPYFTVHAAGGNVLCYYNLARHLGPERPVYALQAPGLEMGQQAFHRLEDLAACHVAAIRAVRKKGPYLLGGWSAGGTTAYEIARQLEALGEEVAFVALMDTYAPVDDYQFDELRLLMWQVWRLKVPLAMEELVRLASFEERLKLLIDRALKSGCIPAHITADEAQRTLMVEIANLKAVLAYRPRRIMSNLLYFHCQEKSDFGQSSELFPWFNNLDHAATWREITGLPVTVYEIPCDHSSLMSEPYVEVLANQLRLCIAGVETQYQDARRSPASQVLVGE